jgi:hypothetical protein
MVWFDLLGYNQYITQQGLPHASLNSKFMFEVKCLKLVMNENMSMHNYNAW